MSFCRAFFYYAVKWGCGLAVSFTVAAAEISIGLGTPLTEAEIAKASITIFPDGHNLPEGQGTVKEGKALYTERCALCHGQSGTEGPSMRLAGSIGLFSLLDPLRIRRVQEVNGLLVMSTGQQWPYATSIFDFIRRAMPHLTPKTLSTNQAYALTAYVLYLNDLVDEDQTIDRNNLPRIEMPARSRFVEAR